ncbi:MAG: DNA-formamidopyrimidine glycosylase family protein [Planctomycetota bacterium]
MPELPECERGRRILERFAVGRTILKVTCDDDRIVFDGVAPRTFARKLRGRKVLEACRRGKTMWLRLDRDPHPLFHFGMTGGFEVPGGRHLRLESDRSRRAASPWPPRFTKVHLTFDDGGELVMTNKRRLGRIRLRDEPLHEPPIRDLGFDPLLDPPDPAAFVDLLSRRTGTVKGLLLDQSFAAGVGNWIADEVLYQARIDPRRRACDLSAPEGRRLRTKLISIITKACAVDAEKARFPKSWLFHHRWGKVEGATTAKGEAIESITVAGRTTAWVPAVQE